MSLTDATTPAYASGSRPLGPEARATATELIRAEIEVLRRRILDEDTDEA